MEVALGLEQNVNHRVPRELLDHVIEEAHSCLDRVGAEPSRSMVAVIAVSLVRRSIVAVRLTLVLVGFCIVSV